MIRIKRLLIAAIVAALLALGAAGSALAGGGGSRAPGSCGLGKEGAHLAISLPIGPGASEFATFPPSEADCTGH